MIRTWLGGNASAALGCVLLAEGQLPAAERELAHAEHVLRDEVATVHSTWVLVLLARVRARRGRLDEAAAALELAQAAMREYGDMGVVGSLADDVGREIDHLRRRAGDGEVLALPSEAELAVLRLLATDSSMREIGAELFISSNTVRSHTRALYRKLGVGQRADAVARGQALGLLGRSQSPR
jgi:LuxR family maltose regulon positive regulatory protein